MTVRIAAAVQHHPARVDLIPQLLGQLAPLDVDVVTDPEPDGRRSAWRTYRLALERTPPDATHRLIVQDDVAPCSSFAAVLERAVRARPDRLLILCVCGQPGEMARELWRSSARGDQWADLHRYRWVPTIALVWPTSLITPALEFVDAQSWPAVFVADDEIVGRACRHLGVVPAATVPSLVEHDPTVESVVRTGPRARRRRPTGNQDPGRTTACPPDPACDLLQIDWAS